MNQGHIENETKCPHLISHLSCWMCIQQVLCFIRVEATISFVMSAVLCGRLWRNGVGFYLLKVRCL